MNNRQRTDLIAAQRRVWGDASQLCAGNCGNEAAPFSCYCKPCEDEIDAADAREREAAFDRC